MILLRAVLCAVGFLTRIPVPGRGAFPPAVLGLSIVFFPAVGLLLGAASAGAAALVPSPHLGWAIVLVAIHAFLTGAMHLDGLSDVVDGLGGARGDRERALEIMRDPRVGAFGVVALVLVLTAKIAAVDAVLRRPDAWPALLAYPAAGRLAAVPLIVGFPCARASGMAHAYHEAARWPAVPAALLFAGLPAAFAPSLLVPTAAALGAGLLAGLYITWRLRGLTGDAYGAAIELAELAFLWAVVGKP
ncbi:MAG TPA: adenosylcobinamide-GDP ribazoletransferase [Planctomycetota bacterium]|nr:adenosylcobinamide-GDP ribazoletransferase [Planctomycetota bacterium]